MKLMKILLLFIIPSLALANGYNFVVENTAMVDTYFNIFNAIASLLKSEDYSKTKLHFFVFNMLSSQTPLE